MRYCLLLLFVMVVEKGIGNRKMCMHVEWSEGEGFKFDCGGVGAE